MESHLKDRLKILASHYGLSIRALEDRCGLSRNVIGNMSDTGTLGADKLSKILDAVPEVNPIWLISGRGDMLGETVRSEAHPVGKVAEGRRFSTATRPRIPLTAAAGELAELISPTSDAECERFPVIPSFARYDFTIIIEGDSMAPDYLPGDELACALVDDSADIKWGRPYVLDTERGIVFKRLYDGGDSIMCTSINPTGPSFIIDKTDIHHIAAVVGYLRAAQ